jgi:PRC-barrel domain
MEEIMLNTKTTVKLACSIAFALGTVALAAQQKATLAGGERGDLDEIRKVSTLIGTHVMNRANTKIADFRDVVFSPEGAVMYAVLGYGGVVGVGETLTVAPFDALEVRLADGKWAVNLDMTAEDLKKAPTIQSENYRELTDPQWIARVDQFFRPRIESPGKSEPGTVPAQRERRPVERVLLATKLRAAKPKNSQNEELGKLEDLLLDGRNRVVFVILGRGGVLGVGENYIPIPWSKLGLGYNQENAAVTVTIDTTKAQLEKAPLIKGDNYATLLAPGFADGVRRYFGVTGRDATTGAEGERR